MGNIVTDNLPPLPNPEGFRTRYRSEQGMVGNYPWIYSDRAIRKTTRPEHEDQDLFTAEQMRAYARAAVDRASLEAVPNIEVVLDRFEIKDRGLPQAHIASELVAELRAMLSAAQKGQK